MKKVNTRKFWSFELGTQEGINVLPIWNFVGFQQRDRQEAQNLANETVYRPPATSGQCNIGTEKHPGKKILLIYDDDEYIQCYGQIKEDFNVLTKDENLEPYINYSDFRSSNDGNDLEYNLYVCDIRYQKNLESSQPIKVKFKFSENVFAGIYG